MYAVKLENGTLNLTDRENLTYLIRSCINRKLIFTFYEKTMVLSTAEKICLIDVFVMIKSLQNVEKFFGHKKNHLIIFFVYILLITILINSS